MALRFVAFFVVFVLVAGCTRCMDDCAAPWFNIQSRDGSGFRSLSIDPGACDPPSCATTDTGAITAGSVDVHRDGTCRIHATLTTGEHVDREVHVREAEGVCCAGPRIDDSTLNEMGGTLEL